MTVFSPPFPRMLEMEAMTLPSQPTRLMQSPFHDRKEATVAKATNRQSHGTNDNDENRARRGRRQPHPRLSKAIAFRSGDKNSCGTGTYEVQERDQTRSRRTLYQLVYKLTWWEPMSTLDLRKEVALRATNPLTRTLRVRPKGSILLKTALQ